MTLVEFILARQADRQQRMRDGYTLVPEESAHGHGWCRAECHMCSWESFGGTESVVVGSWYEHVEWAHERAWVMADIAAKRRIVELHADQHECADLSGSAWPYVGCQTLRLLALPHASHPDYQESWRPDAVSRLPE